MKVLVNFVFLVLLASHVALSSRPTEINAAVLLHVVSLTALVMLMLVGSVLRNKKIVIHEFSLWLATFIFYFFTVGVLTSAATGAPLREIFEFPYRISNLLIALLYPAWLTTSKDVKFLLRAGFGMVLVQVVRDLAVGGMTFGSAILTSRLAGQNYGALAHLAAPGFLIAWSLVDWEVIKRKRILQLLLLFAVTAIALKIILMYARTVWLVIIPMDVILVLIMLRKRERRRMRRPVIQAVTMVLVAGAIVIAASPNVRSFMSGRLQMIGRHADIKADEYRAVAASAVEDPILGKGFSYDLEFQKGRYMKQQAHVHNVILQFLFSAGILGLGLFLWGVIRLARSCWRLQKSATDPLTVAVAIASTLTLANFFMLGMVQSVFRREHTYLMVAICITLLVSVRRIRIPVAPSVSGSLSPGLAQSGRAEKVTTTPRTHVSRHYPGSVEG